MLVEQTAPSQEARVGRQWACLRVCVVTRAARESGWAFSGIFDCLAPPPAHHPSAGSRPSQFNPEFCAVSRRAANCSAGSRSTVTSSAISRNASVAAQFDAVQHCLCSTVSCSAVITAQSVVDQSFRMHAATKHKAPAQLTHP